MEERITNEPKAGTSTAHGLHNVCTEGLGIRKIIWIGILLVSTCLLAWLLLQSIIDFRKFDSFVSTKIEENEELAFPAITACNIKPYNKSKVPQQLQDFDYTDVESLRKQTIFENDSLIDVLKMVSFTEEELFVDCMDVDKRYFLVEKKKCFDFVSSLLLPDFGRCVTFNGQFSKRKLPPSHVAGLTNALTLTFDVNSDSADTELLHSPSTRVETGFIVAIHDQLDFPNFDEQSFFVRPGGTTRVSMKKVNKKILGRPYSTRECIEDIQKYEPDPLTKTAMDFYNLPYSYDLCYYNCILHSYDRLGCGSLFTKSKKCKFLLVLANIIQKDKLLITGASLGIGNHSYDYGSLSKCRKCLHTCTETSYITQISQANFQESTLQALLQDERPNYNTTKEDITKNIVQLVVHYETLDVTTMDQKPAVSSAELFGEVGGLLHFFLGVGLISLFEGVDFLIRKVAVEIKKRRRGETEVPNIRLENTV